MPSAFRIGSRSHSVPASSITICSRVTFSGGGSRDNSGVCAFINPAGFQTNLMVQKPGGYVFSDFARVGIPLTIIVGAVVLLLAPIMYAF